MNDNKFSLAVIGAGWRTDFFLTVAAAVEKVEICGIVARNPKRAAEVEACWGVPCFPDIASLLEATSPLYAVASVSADAMPAVCLDLATRGVPVLAETPPATDLNGLIALYEATQKLDARIQVAEQYRVQPLHAARLAVIESGILGPVSQAQVSVCHGYHGMSLIRRLLGIGFECPLIRGHRFVDTVIAGPDRAGPPQREDVVDVETDYAWLDFGEKFGVFDFCLPQYRNWIRGQRVCVRGRRGEIIDRQVIYLQDETTPITSTLTRHEAGQNGNLEGLHLKGIQYLGRWVYRNPLLPARLTDEEIAVGQCLLEMQRYVETGESFYSLAEACQDQYLALACAEAISSGNAVKTTPQIWT